MIDQLLEFIHSLPDWPAVRIPLTAILGVVGVRLTALLARRLAAPRVSPQAAMLIEKLIWYGGFVATISWALHALGMNLGALMGAAGIAGIALGFASQSSLSHIISGLFLVTEKPFEVGDLIRIGSTLGTVHSVDLLSVKVRTLDNQFVRIPNENLIKTEVTNITRFPIRRMDLNLSVAYKENLSHVLPLLREVAEKHPLVLDEPEPLLMVVGFGESGVDIRLGVWFAKENFIEVRNGMLIGIKERLDAEGIEIPFPHRTLYAGAASGALPVRMVPPDDAPAKSETP